MSATQELIAAALAECDLMTGMLGYEPASLRDLREACARAMVQPAAPDMAEAVRLVDAYEDAYFHSTNLGFHETRTALLDYVRGILAERDALIADNERLSGLYEQAVKGRADMRSALRDARAAAPQPVGAAEVPMPEPVGWIGWIRHDEGGGRHPMFSTYEPTAYEHRDQVAAMPDVRTYGDAREAAGCARGLAAGPPKDCGDAGHDEGRCGNASCGRPARAGLVSKVIERRLRTWRQSRMNKSGDRLSLDDFMGPDSIDDLVDCVCDEFAIDAALLGEVK